MKEDMIIKSKMIPIKKGKDIKSENGLDIFALFNRCPTTVGDQLVVLRTYTSIYVHRNNE